LSALGVEKVLYVGPRASVVELDDINDDFVAYAARKIEVKPLFTDAFQSSGGADAGASPDGGPTYFYGGRSETNAWFWTDYPWAKSDVPKGKVDPHVDRNATYVPTPRATAFSSGAVSGSRPAPARFGTVPVVLAAGTGLVLGLQLGRSGSWNRSSGGYGG
jgi:hypothetical protein